MVTIWVSLFFGFSRAITLLSSHTQIIGSQRFTVSELRINQDDVQTPGSSVLEFGLTRLATAGNNSGEATARLSFSSPVSEWQRQFIGYIPEDIEVRETAQCVQLLPPFLQKLTEDDFDDHWAEWLARIYKEDGRDQFRVPTVDFSDPNRRVLAQTVCVEVCAEMNPVQNKKRFYRLSALSTTCAGLTNYWSAAFPNNELACPAGKNRYAKQILQPPPLTCLEEPVNWAFVCLQDSAAYVDFSTNCAFQDQSRCNNLDPVTQTCRSDGTVGDLGSDETRVAANTVGVGNFFSKDCVDQSYLAALQEITKNQYNQVFSAAPGVYEKILQQELAANEDRDQMITFLANASETISSTLARQQELSVRIGEFTNRTVAELEEKSKKQQGFVANFLSKREDFKKEWSDGFSTTLQRAENRASQLDQEAQFVFSLLGTLDIAALRQRELIFDLTEEVEALLRSARVSLRDTNELRTGRREKRLANALVWSYTDFLLQSKTSQGLSGWSWLKSRGSRPKGRVGLREAAQAPWHRFTLVQQYDWTDGTYASADPWARQRLQLENAQAYLDYMHVNGKKKWLDVTTFEFYVNPDYLLEEIDTWFTFEDIKAMVGPAGCFPPEIKGDSAGVAPLPPGREYCRGWAKIKRSRCARGDQPFWQPLTNQSAFTDLNASSVFGGTNGPCDRGQGENLEIKTELFFDRQEASLKESSSCEHCLTGFPEIELATSSVIVDSYLELLCRSSSNTLYWNTGVLSLEPGTLGTFSALEAGSKCSTYPTTMEIQSVEGGKLTLPYIFYKSGQLAAQTLFLGAQGQWEIDKYGALPDNLEGYTSHFTHPYGFQQRFPSLRRFFFNSEHHYVGTTAPTMPDIPPTPTLRCKKHGLAFVSPFMVPVWRISHLESFQTIRVEVFAPDGTALQNYTQNIPVNPPSFENSAEFLVAGYLECIHQPCQYLLDFYPEDLSAAPEPSLREHKASYFMLFLQSEYGQTLEEYVNATDKEPASNPLIDQTSHFALNLDCSTKKKENCFSTTYFAPQPVPPDAANLWQMQNRLQKFNTRYLGSKGGQVRKLAIQDPLTGDTECQVQAAGRKGTLCSWLETEIVQRSQRTLDTTPGGRLTSYRKQWSATVPITIVGAAFNGTFEVVEGSRGCPSLQDIQLRPQLESGDGVSQWVIAVQNPWATGSYLLSVHFSVHGGRTGHLEWDAAESWAGMNCTHPHTISKDFDVSPLSQKMLILPAFCQEEATISFSDRSTERVCASYPLEKEATQQRVITSGHQTTWARDFFHTDLQTNNQYQALLQKPDFEALAVDSKTLLLTYLLSQRSKLQLRKDLLNSLQGLCLEKPTSCRDLSAELVNNFASTSYSFSKLPALLWGKQGVRSFQVQPGSLAEQDKDDVHETLSLNVKCTQEALESAFQTGLEISTIQQDLEANVKLAEDNLLLVQEGIDELRELDSKIKEAYAILEAALTNIGPYESPLRNMESTGRSTAITPTGQSLGNVIFLPGKKYCGFGCKIKGFKIKVNLPKMKKGCYLLGIVKCDSCGRVETGMQDVPVMGELTALAGKVKCLFINGVLLFFIGSFLVSILSVCGSCLGKTFGKMLIAVFCCPFVLCEKGVRRRRKGRQKSKNR